MTTVKCEKRDKPFEWTRSGSSGSIGISNNNNNNNNNNNYLHSAYLFSRTAPTSPRSTPYTSQANSPPTSPISTSPPKIAHPKCFGGPLRRTYSSTFTLIPEDRAINVSSMRKDDLLKRPVTPPRPTSRLNIAFRLLFWWPYLLIGIVGKIWANMSWGPFMMTSPGFWLSACLWIFWKTISFPLACAKNMLIVLHTPSAERNRKKKTVLISCGSTIQTLHMARNFYKSGARVVVFEVEGLFALARFSTAVSKFYTISRPTSETTNEYINALCEIVEKEKPSHYIPISATTAAYYDALAKPHLELLGCSSYIPGAQEVSVLDDVFQVFKKCDAKVPLPPYKLLTSKEELFRLYDNGWMSGFRNLMFSTGQQSILERNKYILPPNKRDMRLSHEISDQRPWLVVRDLPGLHYVTCTTVKESKVIANVTCLIQPDTHSLTPEINTEIEDWLKDFFAIVRLQRPITGHMSFRFVKCKTTGHLLPIGTRVGVSLPYICYTGVHSKILYKPCPHFSRQNSGPLLQEGGRYWIHDSLLSTFRNPSKEAVIKLIGNVLDKREALFVYWDPLPYCAFYHFQLPFQSITTFLQRRQATRKMATLSAPVQ